VNEDKKVIEFLRKKDYIMLNEELGSGAFGKTVLLKDPYIDELFVAKEYAPPEEKRKEFFKNFLAEIKILYKLNHRNIVRIYNYYLCEDSQGYILMEFIDGQEIDEYSKTIPSHELYGDVLSHKWLSMDEIFMQLIDGFQYIEKFGVVHRDIRERNILIDKTGIVKIIDFGIGKIQDESIENSDDSLRTIINRRGSETLPVEYEQKKYNSNNM